nr:MAG TPA: METHICILLIN RESISTANCE REGULATORY PROTEIN MECI ANTIBIOTIC RESISTANCE, MECI PROTEIN [Caudoviricetes sp.]
MLYRICKRLIERGQTAGLADKLDVFFAMNRITEAEYKELIELLEAKTGNKSEEA